MTKPLKIFILFAFCLSNYLAASDWRVIAVTEIQSTKCIEFFNASSIIKNGNLMAVQEMYVAIPELIKFISNNKKLIDAGIEKQKYGYISNFDVVKVTKDKEQMLTTIFMQLATNEAGFMALGTTCFEIDSSNMTIRVFFRDGNTPDGIFDKTKQIGPLVKISNNSVLEKKYKIIQLSVPK